MCINRFYRCYSRNTALLLLAVGSVMWASNIAYTATDSDNIAVEHIDTFINEYYRVDVFKEASDNEILYDYKVSRLVDNKEVDELKVSGILDCTVSPSGILVYESFYNIKREQRAWRFNNENNSFEVVENFKDVTSRILPDAQNFEILSCQLPSNNGCAGIISTKLLDQQNRRFEYSLTTFEFDKNNATTINVIDHHIYGYQEAIRAYLSNADLIIVVCDDSTARNDIKIEIYPLIDDKINVDRVEMLAQIYFSSSLPMDTYSDLYRDDEVAGVSNTYIYLYDMMNSQITRISIMDLSSAK